MDSVDAYLTLSADDSINLDRSGASSRMRKDPVATCSSTIVEGENNEVILTRRDALVRHGHETQLYESSEYDINNNTGYSIVPSSPPFSETASNCT